MRGVRKMGSWLALLQVVVGGGKARARQVRVTLEPSLASRYDPDHSSKVGGTARGSKG